MDLGRQAARIRRARERHGRAGRGNPYPEWLRRQALDYARVRRADGAAHAEISRELGLPALTLARWSEAYQGSFVPVLVERSVSATPGESAFVVHGPRGLRVEGLSIAELAALLRELS
jgi:hypothetical protein